MMPAAEVVTNSPPAVRRKHTQNGCPVLDNAVTFDEEADINDQSPSEYEDDMPHKCIFG